VFAGRGGPGWLGAHVVADAGDDVAEVVQVVAGQGVEQQADGTFVSTTTPGPEDAGRGVRTVRVFVRSDAAQLARLVARVDAGDLQIEVAERRPLTDLAAVHDQAAAGRLAGKTVLTP
jgi:NADPH:quinone reductase-like Zn-dependent oxidoreductase